MDAFDAFVLAEFDRMTRSLFGGSVTILRVTRTKVGLRWDETETEDGPYDADVQVGTTNDDVLDQQYVGWTLARIFLPEGAGPVGNGDKIRDESDGAEYEVIGPVRRSSEFPGYDVPVAAPGPAPHMEVSP